MKGLGCRSTQMTLSSRWRVAKNKIPDCQWAQYGSRQDGGLTVLMWHIPPVVAVGNTMIASEPTETPGDGIVKLECLPMPISALRR